MKFQIHSKQIIIIAFFLQLNTLFMVECISVRKYLLNTAPVTTPIAERETKELVKSNLTSSNSTNLTFSNSTNLPTSHVAEIKNSNSINIKMSEEELPDSVKTGFYILMGAGFIGLCFIIYKAFQLRMSRAERRYGVQGDRSAQELTPLPIAIDEDSDNEDQTIFERNHS